MKFFTPDDFETIRQDYSDEQIWEYAASISNAKLEREGKVVYGEEIKSTKAFIWTGPQHTFPAENPHVLGATHKALLINIETLGCQHKNTKIWEPHLAGARKCIDCELVWNNNVGKWYCEHPTNKIKKYMITTPISLEGPMREVKVETEGYQCQCGAKVTPIMFEEVK